MQRLHLLAVLLFISLSANADPKQQTPYHWGEAAIVQTAGGKVAGFIRNGALEFRGIAYAAPVGGENRWTSPKPAAPWEGVLPAMHFKEACAQGARYGLTERSDNEDCLYLNVTVPYAGGDLSGRKLPVIVWIHGGAFVGGSSALYRLDVLAKKADAVVVTMNYRIGVFGFMPHPAFEADHNGGYALEDQRLALRWVKANIAAFGGDPDNITLAGESAGAASVCMHLIAPEETRNLFNKAIVQSGACVYRMRSVEERKSFGVAVAKQAGCTDAASALECLRQKGPQTLIAAATDVAGNDLLAFAPVYGTKTTPLQGLEAIESGRFVKVPVINGGTRDELRLYVGYDVQAGKRFTPENYEDVIKSYYGENAGKIAAQYPLKDFSSAPAALGTLMTNFRPDLGINHCLYIETARLMSRYVPVYQWEFADRKSPVLGVSIPISPDPGFELGAVHSSELNSFFPNFSNTTAISGPDLSQRSQAMADEMIETWASFIRTGKPKARDVPDWKPYSEGATAIRFEPGQIRTFDPTSDYKCAFWKSLYPSYFAK
ncbi:Carboxylic ester hydrolase [Hyphomicrobium sp. 1Nfss2.1]|uniref:carboxylesterase/lipase family protein n=1 Tax=Hyphomicrobium sp. 1Nfss2.1 TaxID=3413936 RepID=UPI003C7BEF71